MKCVICKTGNTEPSKSSTVFDQDGRVIVVRDVPAQVCQQCGEAYFSKEVTAQVYEQVMQVMEGDTEVEITRLKAA